VPLTKPHDELFKATLTPEAARQLCKAVLPAGAGGLFDRATLIREPETFVEGALASDVLYRAELEGGGEALVYVLFEHQSTVDPLMAYRVLRYMVRIWGRWLRERSDEAPQRLPPILPIVVYHGESEWSAARDFQSLVELPEALVGAAELVPSFRYVLDDLRRAGDEEIRSREAPPDATLAWIFFSQAYERDRGAEVLEACLDLFAPLVARLPMSKGLLEQFFTYSLRVGFGDESDLSNALSRLGGPDLEELVVTAGEKLIEKGRAQGHEEGHEEGRQVGRLEGARHLFSKLLVQRDGPLSELRRERIERASLEELESWAERLASGDRLEDVFGS